jgi:hypothetical protein
MNSNSALPHALLHGETFAAGCMPTNKSEGSQNRFKIGVTTKQCLQMQQCLKMQRET